METINYTKDVHKPIIAILAESNFQPYGALGAISASAVRSIILADDDISGDVIETDNDNVNLIHSENQCTILICTVDDGAAVGQLIYNDFGTKNLHVGFENLSKSNSKCSVRQCTLFVPILTPQLEQTPVCRAAFEEARRLQKPIVPAIAIKSWRPEDWLGLTIAGRTFFRIFDKESAYKPFFDSNRITDLRVEVEVACRPTPIQAEREEAEIKMLKEKIEQCEIKLRTWPPPRKPRSLDLLSDRQPVRVTLDEPNAKHRFLHIHHSITRIDMVGPPQILDECGLPKRRDIDSYIKSTNCQMEFRYAVKRGKAFVIIRTEPNIQMEQWMLDAIQGFPQYNIFSYEALEALVNGIPMIDVIMQAIRKIAHAQPPDVIDDCSAKLFELRCLLDDARDAISAESGQSRYKKCTRCGQQYDEYAKSGCKYHVDYYISSNIVENRWVCCRQQAKDSPGCRPCDHTDVVRVFTQDRRYGTWTWVPP
ncbi:unnamed protein product [Rotaria sp. Silwood2]|nr:unnamed protein product [Rotaria sp. Silwood2]